LPITNLRHVLTVAADIKPMLSKLADEMLLESLATFAGLR
jgi:hypothetical protein